MILALVLPEKWEAHALVRVGQIENIDGRIETPEVAVERMKSLSFQNDVLNNLGVSILADNVKAKAFHKNLKVKLDKSELINLTLSGASRSEVGLHVEGVVNELKSKHKVMYAPTVQRLKQELAMIDLELKRTNVETEWLRKFLKSSTSQDLQKNVQAVLASSVLLASEAELRACRDRKRSIEAQLSSVNTFPTDVVGKIEISSNPVFPKVSFFAVAGLFLGLFFGLLFTILKANR